MKIKFVKNKHALTTYSALAVFAFVGSIGILATSSALTQGATEDISVTTDSNPPNNTTGSRFKISPDGRYVYFVSNASNIVTNDTNSSPDLFVRDRITNTTSMLSVNSAGQQANYGVYAFDVSDGGRYIVFSSPSTNLVTPDNNSGTDIFLRDTETNQTSLIFRNSTTGQSADVPVISGDGNWIAFTTRHSSSPYSDGYTNVYLINRQSLGLARISNGTSGAANASSSNPDINYDGRVISFESSASNLVSGDTNSKIDIFAWKRDGSTISRVNISNAGTQTNNQSESSRISGDGNKIAFNSYATNLDPSATAAAKNKVFLRQLDTNTISLINQTTSGAEGNDQAWIVDISSSGNYVGFNSAASNLVSGDANGVQDYFVRSLENNTTSLASLDSSGNQYSTSSAGRGFSADGQYAVFTPDSYKIFLRY